MILSLLFPFPVIAAQTLNIVATLPTLAAIAQEIGQEHVRVRAMASPNEDAHYVDARPNMILWLSDADILIANGLELEVGWLPTLQQSSRNSKIMKGGSGFLEVAHVVQLQDVHHGHVDRSHGDVHPGGNPHFLNDARAGVPIIKQIAEHLSRNDPDRQSFYQEQAKKLSYKVALFEFKQRRKFKKIPRKHKKVVTYHKSLTYLLDWLNLKEISTIEPKPGIPPRPAHVALVLKKMRRTQTRLILQEEYYPSQTSQTLAKLTNGRLLILPGGVRFEEGQSYLQYLEDMTNAIYQAIQ